jgi:hypothetical protein
MRRSLLALSVGMLLLFVVPVRADLLIGSLNTAHTINFDTTVANVNNGAFTAAGFQPSPTAGQLDSDSWEIENNVAGATGDMAFGATETGSNFARGTSTGGVTSGGIYAFDVDSSAGVNRVFGVQPSSNTFDGSTGGFITLRLQNTTGAAVQSWNIDYLVYAFNDQGRSSSLNFSYSTNGTTFTSIPGLNFTTAEAASGTPVWTNVSRSTTIGATVANNANFYLRWTIADVAGSGSRDELGIDGISVVAAVPEASAFVFGGTICTLTGLCVLRRKRRS